MTKRFTYLRVIALITAIILLPVAGLGGYLGGLQLVGNVHTIEPGVAYRSAQLSRTHLEALVDLDGIKSIVSLVRPEPQQSWYRDEIAVSAERNLVRYELPLSANKELTADQLHHLLSILQKAPRPVLIHCKNGADRSGLAAAIFEYAIASRSRGESLNQLSLRYGHIPYFWSRTGAMNASFEKFLLQHPADSNRQVNPH